MRQTNYHIAALFLQSLDSNLCSLNRMYKPYAGTVTVRHKPRRVGREAEDTDA